MHALKKCLSLDLIVVNAVETGEIRRIAWSRPDLWGPDVRSVHPRKHSDHAHDLFPIHHFPWT